MKAAVELRHLGHLVLGLKAARIGQQPERRFCDSFVLLAHFRSRAAEGRAVGPEPEYGDDVRSEVFRLRLEMVRAGA